MAVAVAGVFRLGLDSEPGRDHPWVVAWVVPGITRFSLHSPASCAAPAFWTGTTRSWASSAPSASEGSGSSSGPCCRLHWNTPNVRIYIVNRKITELKIKCRLGIIKLVFTCIDLRNETNNPKIQIELDNYVFTKSSLNNNRRIEDIIKIVEH